MKNSFKKSNCKKESNWKEGKNMMYIIGSRNGKDVIVSDKEIIENALQQEKEGIKPDFSPRYMPDVKGWLIWSNYKYGAGIVYRRKSDSKMIIITGVQGDFTIC